MKINNLFYSVLALVLLAASSCKKEDPQPETPGSPSSGAPVFSFSGNINGSPIALQAGGQGYFMSTSCIKDSTGVYNYVGELKPKDCNGGCGNSLKISIRNYRQFGTLPTSIDSAIVSGYYSFATPSGAATQYTMTFISGLQAGTAQTYRWDFGDGIEQVVTSSTVAHTYFHPGVYKVSLKVETAGGCESTITNDVQFGQTGNSFLPQFKVSYSADSTIASFIPIPIGGIPPYTYLWDFGDGSTSNSFSPTHKYTAPGVYKVSLTMKDILGTSAIQYSNVAIKSGGNCASYFVSITASPLPNPLNLGGVVIEWTDADGKVWTSESNSQSSSSSVFKVISVEDYINNPNGDPTKKFHVKFSCTLYNGLRSIKMSNFDGVFSIAYK